MLVTRMAHWPKSDEYDHLSIPLFCYSARLLALEWCHPPTYGGLALEIAPTAHRGDYVVFRLFESRSEIWTYPATIIHSPALNYQSPMR